MEDYTRRMGAAELMSSAYCNANCRYCYIPKVQEMKELHQQIIEDLKSDKPLERLKDIYEDRLESLSVWGTEPTLILDYFTPNLYKYIEAFPKLDSFSFSTNFLTHTDTIYRFIEKMNELGEQYQRKLRADIQISLDGPAFITDNNRQAGATEKIVANYDALLQWIKDKVFTHIQIRLRFKPTLTMEQFKLFNDDFSTFDKYFSFFDDVVELGVSKQIPEEICSIAVPSSGTLMVPGKYTSEDGKEFATYMRNLNEFDFYIIQKQPYKHYRGNVSEYVGRLRRILQFSGEIFSKPEMFTCSGGDSNFAIDRTGNIHICHRSFYLNEDKYAEAVAKTDIDNWDVSVFMKERNKALQKTYIVDPKDNEAKARLHYSMRGFHDFTRFRVNNITAMLLELIDCNQASKVYKDPELARTLAMFVASGFGCSIENIINTGNVHLTPLSILRLLANGAFEEILKHYIELEAVRK